MSDGITFAQNEDGTFGVYDDTYDVVIHCETEEEQKKVIERLKATNWIPVSERLPEDDMTVLASCKTSKGATFVRTGYCINGSWYLNCEGVKAWKPLPKPYKEG